MTFEPRSILRVGVPLIFGSIAVGALFKASLNPHVFVRDVGLALACLGLAGVVLARYTLGRSFSVRAKATALVTRGIYSRIRNPIYVFGEFFLLGAALIIWRIEMVGLLLLLVPVQIIRARREAAVLEAKFGDEYREYRKRTWF
jgi:protein-S-isoprenylcysteine O-methyltransferase Ste14